MSKALHKKRGKLVEAKMTKYKRIRGKNLGNGKENKPMAFGDL